MFRGNWVGHLGKSQSGGALLSAIVAAGVLGIGAYSSMRFVADWTRHNKYADQRIALVNLFENVRLAVKGMDSCKEMLAGPGVSVNLGPGGTAVLSAIKIGSENLTLGKLGPMDITKLELRDVVGLPATDDEAGVARTHRRAQLVVGGIFTTDEQTMNFERAYLVDVLTDAGGLVVGCYRGQDVDMVACETMAGTGVGAFVAATKTCNMPANSITSAKCPAGQCIGGFDSKNVAQCRAE